MPREQRDLPEGEIRFEIGQKMDLLSISKKMENRSRSSPWPTLECIFPKSSCSDLGAAYTKLLDVRREKTCPEGEIVIASKTTELTHANSAG